MSFVNPETLRKIFARDPSAPQGRELWSMVAGAGAGMAQAAGQPGAGFGQALGGGAAGMGQAQHQFQQQEYMRQQQEHMRRKAEREEAMQKGIMDLILGKPTGGDWAGQVDAQLPQTPQLPQAGPAQATPMQQGGGYSSQPIGGLSTLFESNNNPAAINNGRGDPGGASYGRFQLASGPGTLQRFFESEEGRPFATQFGDLDPGSPQFNQIWTELSTNPEVGAAFDQAQEQYIRRTHVEPNLQRAQRAGFDVQNPGVAEAIASMGVQHGGAGNLQILNEAAARIGSDTSPERAIDALYDARARYVESLPEFENREGVLNRYNQERVQAKQIARAGQQQGGGGIPPTAQAALGQQPAQPQQNGYQQPAQGGLFDGLPEQTRQFLAMMAANDPSSVMPLIQQQMGIGGKDDPADVRTAQVIAQQQGREVGDVLAEIKGIGPYADQGGGFTTATQSLMQKARLFRAADPNLSEAEALNLALGRNRVSRDPVTGQVDIIDIHTGQAVGRGTQELYDSQVRADESEIDASLAFGAPAVLANVRNTLFDIFGAELPRPDVEEAVARVTSLGIQGDVLLSRQFSGRVSNQLLDMIGQLKASPSSFFQGPSRGKERLEEMTRLIGRDLDRQRRVANDPNQGAQSQREARVAVEALTDYKRELDNVLNTWGSSRSGQAPSTEGLPPAPSGWEDDWGILTDEERQQVLQLRGMR